MTPEDRRVLIDKVLSLQWCQENLIVPIESKGSSEKNIKLITFAIANFSYLATIGEFVKTRSAKHGYTCQFIEDTPETIRKYLDAATTARIHKGDTLETYEYSDDAILEALREADGASESDGDFKLDLEDTEEESIIESTIDLASEMEGSQIQKAAARILINAIRTNVSDIHIEPKSSEYKVRVRRDGVMQPYVSMPRTAGSRLIACLKNMGQMDIAERRASQDGKILRKYEGMQIEYRCSTAPGKYGEKMVLRTLNSNAEMLSLDTLISDEDVRSDFRDIINEANGIVIVSGPTGSGKSTTLASALRERDTGDLNIVTAEDPIEYDLGGDIQQFPVLRAKGQTFAHLLRTFLRQDPDIILIGETRDPETADSSMDAAETGHLVFTTLHANSAASSLTRLLDMGVAPYKLTASLRGIIAQRLLRKVCSECGVDTMVDEATSEFTGLAVGTYIKAANTLTAEAKEKAKETGELCKNCLGTGYKGRIGAYELLRISRSISDAIRSSMSTREIEQIAIEEGMLTIKAYTCKLIAQQLTTVSELLKICNKEH